MNVDTTKVADDETVVITNLLDHTTGYIVETSNGTVRRFLPAFASFKVKAEELRQLNYTLGGREILRNYIRVGNKSLAAEFGVDVDETPEYNWTEKDVVDCLNSSDIDVLLDALDFAPEGIKQLIADKAVELEVPDVNKRKAISESLGVDIDGMIKNKHAYDEQEEEKPKTTRRRTTKSTSAATKTRRKKTEPAATEEAAEK